jgi:hypothetical protein
MLSVVPFSAPGMLLLLHAGQRHNVYCHGLLKKFKSYTTFSKAHALSTSLQPLPIQKRAIGKSNGKKCRKPNKKSQKGYKSC